MNLEEVKKLITRYTNGTATPKERNQLENWYAQRSDQHQLPNDDDYSHLKEKMFLATLKRAGIEPQKYPFKKQTARYTFIKLALVASVLLAFGAYLYFLSGINFGKNSQNQAIVKTILPGSNKAILTLADGSNIPLDNTNSDTLSKQSGTTITKMSAGQLVYIVSNDSVLTARGGKVTETFNTLTTPVGGQFQVVLPDGTHVWLNALSSLKYPVAFNGKERKVELTGEAYFEVAHNKLKPFKVKNADQTVEVLGTHFNIMAYKDEKTSKTTLLEGSIKLTYKDASELLKPGQQAQLVNNQISITSAVDLEDVTAWKNGYFKFNENIESIMNKISRWYNVEVVYKSTFNPNLTFEGKISRSRDLSEVLKIIEYNGKVHFKMQGRRIIVFK